MLPGEQHASSFAVLFLCLPVAMPQADNSPVKVVFWRTLVFTTTQKDEALTLVTVPTNGESSWFLGCLFGVCVWGGRGTALSQHENIMEQATRRLFLPSSLNKFGQQQLWLPK